MLARHGKVVDYRTYGVRDLATGAPMTKDTIFRDYSMTKPVTGVAMMILYEQGKWLPSDPISKYIPEFAHLKVFNGVDADGKMILVDPDHAPTMRELMTHTAGFSYGFFGNTPVDQMYRDAQSLRLEESPGVHRQNRQNPPRSISPAKAGPTRMSMDIEGYIVEKLSGQSLPDFMRDQIFTPLGMKDAGFYVPADKRARFATVYPPSPTANWLPPATAIGRSTDYASEPAHALRRRRHRLHRRRLLPLRPDAAQWRPAGRQAHPRSRYRQAHDLQPPAHRTAHRPIWHRLAVMRPGFGYGYNCAVVFDPPEANLPEGKGTFFWDGAAGTWFWVDPTNDVVFIGMIQRMLGPASPNLEYGSRAVVYGALVDPAR